MTMNIDEQFALAFLKCIISEKDAKDEIIKEKPKPEFRKSIKHIYENDIEKLKEKLKSKIQDTSMQGIERFSIEKQPEQRKLRPLLPVPIPVPEFAAKKNIPIPPRNTAARHFQPLKPVALDLEELNSFVQNSEITSIQCEGAGIPLKIAKSDDIVETSVVLNEEKIKSIIKKFSEASGKPLTEPVFKAAFGNLTMMAIISESGARFMIIKS